MADPPARSRARRISDTRAMLDSEVDCWVATASAAGVPHLVALSFGRWDGKIVLATPGAYRTAANLRENPRVRLAFGSLRDVVIVHGTADLRDLPDVPEALLDDFAEQAGFDARSDARHVIVEVTPVKVLAWRTESELRGRVLMRDGAWIEEEEG